MSEINDGSEHHKKKLNHVQSTSHSHPEKVSWAQAYDRLVMGYSPVCTTIDVSPFDIETEARLQRTTPIIPPPLTYYMPAPRPIAAIELVCTP